MQVHVDFGNTLIKEESIIMFDKLLQLMGLLFTPYFVGLLVVCGIILSFVYPIIIADSKYPVEYKIGKYAGYIYISGSLVIYIIVMLFS